MSDEALIAMFEMDKHRAKPVRYWAHFETDELAAVRADPNVAKVVQTTDCDPRGPIDYKVCLNPGYSLQAPKVGLGRHLLDDVEIFEWHDDGAGVVYHAKLTLEGYHAVSRAPGVHYVMRRLRTHLPISLGDYIALYESKSKHFTPMSNANGYEAHLNTVPPDQRVCEVYNVQLRVEYKLADHVQKVGVLHDSIVRWIFGENYGYDTTSYEAELRPAELAAVRADPGVEWVEEHGTLILN